MRMLARLRYLLAEGFDVQQVDGTFGSDLAGQASIRYQMPMPDGSLRRYSEHYYIDRAELEACHRVATLRQG